MEIDTKIIHNLVLADLEALGFRLRLSSVFPGDLVILSFKLEPDAKELLEAYNMGPQMESKDGYFLGLMIQKKNLISMSSGAPFTSSLSGQQQIFQGHMLVDEDHISMPSARSAWNSTSDDFDVHLPVERLKGCTLVELAGWAVNMMGRKQNAR